MKVDERDLRLGELLDWAVRGIEAEGSPATVGRRGSRRRAVTVFASLTSVAVFLAGVGFAATQVGRDAENVAITGRSGVFASPDFPWTIPVPEGWKSGGARFVGGPRHMLQDFRASFVTNSPVVFDGVPRPHSSPLPAGVDDSDVIVVVDPFGRTGASQPSTFVLNAAEHDDFQNPGWTTRDGKLCGETGCARVYIWHGPDTSDADLATAMSVAEGVRMVETRPNPSLLVPKIGYRDGEDGFSMSYPAGWTVADETLTPQVGGGLSHEILSVGTFPLEPGGGVLAPLDSLLPGNAIADVGPQDVFVSVEERTFPGASTFPRRPSPFDRETACGEAEDSACVGNALGMEEVRTWWIPFSDPLSERGFYAFVAMGQDAYRDPARSAAAWAILESLRFPKTPTLD